MLYMSVINRGLRHDTTEARRIEYCLFLSSLSTFFCTQKYTSRPGTMDRYMPVSNPEIIQMVTAQLLRTGVKGLT